MSGLSTLESGAASSALAPSRNHTRLPNGNGRVHRSAGHPTPYSVVEWFRSATEVLVIYIHTSIHPSIHACMHACMPALGGRMLAALATFQLPMGWLKAIAPRNIDLHRGMVVFV
jgi:hypothetical protein